MHVERIVTGHKDGRAVFMDLPTSVKTAVFKHVPGFVVSTVWSTSADDALGAVADPVPGVTSLVPGPGETRLLIVDFPPDHVLSQISDFAAVGAEYAANLPGLAETFEPHAPGMHRTPTVDYGILLSGELWLELDDKEMRRLGPGDIVIQNATRHAWRNRSNEPAKIAFILIGAKG